MEVMDDVLTLPAVSAPSLLAVFSSPIAPSMDLAESIDLAESVDDDQGICENLLLSESMLKMLKLPGSTKSSTNNTKATE